MKNIGIENEGGFEAYIAKMSIPGTWGDGATLSTAASLYKRSIKVVTDDGSSFIIESPNGFDSEIPLLLGYIGTRDVLLKSHYVALSCKSAQTEPVDVEPLGSSGGASLHASDDPAKESPKQPYSEPESKKSGASDKHVSDADYVTKRKSVYPWLQAVPGGALCAVRSTYYAARPLPTNHTGTFVTKPFNNWKRSTGSDPKNNKLLKHHRCASHSTAVTFDSDAEMMAAKQRTVYSMVHKQSRELQEIQLDRMADFTDVAYYLFKHEIAHTTHFESLLSLVSRLDKSDKIKQFMDASPENATYTSTTIATELLTAVSDWLTNNILDELRSSSYIAVLADESTDLRSRNELCVCFRYVLNGDSVERYFKLQQLQSTDAETVKDAIKNFIVKNGIPPGCIYWMAFDGAANMSGRTNGVQAKLKRELLGKANYIHCRSHLLNLAAANVARDVKPLQRLFSSFNSLWSFFHNSPKRHNILTEIQKVLNDPVLELVRAGDTRWTSNYRSVHAVKVCLRSIVYALQEVHCASGDLSSEAGGLLLTFQNPTSVLLIHALDEMLQPLHVLTLQLQSPKMSLAEVPEKVCYNHQIYLHNYSNYRVDRLDRRHTRVLHYVISIVS